MSLTLAISNTDRLDNGAPTEFVLNRRGAMIGRSPTCDWSLPDARNYISSRHCEVAYRDGFYVVTDVSTNGTFLNGAGDRMGEPRRISEGDRFLIGQYEVVAHLTGEAAAAVDREREAVVEARQASEWGGWDAHGGASPLSTADTGWDPSRPGSGPGLAGHAAPLGEDGGWAVGGDGGWAPSRPAPGAEAAGWGAPPPPADGDRGWSTPPADAVSGSGGWAPRLGTPLAREADHLAQGRADAGHHGAPPPAVAASGWGAAAPPDNGSSGWAAPIAPPPQPVGPSTWEAAPPPSPGASAWSSAAPDRPPPPSTNDVWGALAAGNVIDWAQSGFGQPLAEQRDPLGLNKGAPMAPRGAPVAPAADPGRCGAAPSRVSPAAPAPRAGEPADRTYLPVEPTMPPSAAPTGADYAEAFAAAAGLKPGQLGAPSAATLDRAGQLLRRLVGGLVVMVEARARAKSQMGAEATSLSFDGNNPIKFARTPEQAVAQLLNPVERGFMDADKAIDDAFFDLQSHQMATLKAMQGALRATLDRFSPTAIRARAEQRGLFRRIMPGAREAALWQAYEREFSGVAQGSDEAFMDTFAKEFLRAYEEQSRSRKR